MATRVYVLSAYLSDHLASDLPSCTVLSITHQRGKGAPYAVASRLAHRSCIELLTVGAGARDSVVYALLN